MPMGISEENSVRVRYVFPRIIVLIVSNRNQPFIILNIEISGIEIEGMRAVKIAGNNNCQITTLKVQTYIVTYVSIGSPTSAA